jgi:formylglycine-generating enzyme required for sulfatase activity
VTTGTLLVFADSPISLEIDGKPSGSLSGTPEAPGQRVFTLTPGRHFLKVVSRDFPEVNAAADVQIRKRAQEIVRAMLADQVEPKEAVARAAEAARVEIETAKTRVKELDLRWVAIPAGRFRMGCSSGDKDCSGDEKPTHTVQITKPFKMMATEVTAGQFRTWALSQGYEPPAQPEWSAPDVPVVNNTWNDAQAFCSAFGGRLPTEAEWEYAARRGSEEARYGSIGAVAWYKENSEGKAHPVGAKLTNALGLYDMLGNVWEWCGDWYRDDYYKNGVETDPTGPSSGESRVLRGISWEYLPRFVRVSFRGRSTPTLQNDFLGFRCLRDTNSPVTVPFSPDLKRLDSSQLVASRPSPSSSSAKTAAPAALVAEDFAVVKRKLEEARRREGEAKKQADEAARRRAEQAGLQAEAEAREMAERMAAEDRADRAEFAQQLGAALGQLGQSITDYQKVRRGDLTPLGIYPTPTPAGARIVMGYVPPPTPTPRPAYVAVTPTPMSTPKPKLSCYVNRQEYCTIIRLVNTSGIQIDQAYVNSDRAGGLRPGDSFDKIHDPLPGGVAIDAFTSTGINPDEVQKVEWHLSLSGPLSPCRGYVVYLDAGGAWRTGPSFDKACEK